MSLPIDEHIKRHQVLHKFTQEPSSIPDTMTIGTGNIMNFTPINPFNCSNILVWYSKPFIINQIKIGNVNHLTYPIYEQQITAPDTLEVIERWLKDKILPKMLRRNHAYSLYSMTADSEHPITIEFEGSFDIMALYGTELIR